MKEDKNLAIVGFVLLGLGIIAAMLLLFLLARKKKLEAKAAAERTAAENAAAAASQSTIPPAAPPAQAPGVTDQVLNYLGSMFSDTAPRQDVMNQDPTYVMASRMNDSINSVTITSGGKTALWNELAAKPDEFVKHVVNWYNGQFGGGKTLRQNIEDEWTGDKTAILAKLSKLGL